MIMQTRREFLAASAAVVVPTLRDLWADVPATKLPADKDGFPDYEKILN